MSTSINVTQDTTLPIELPLAPAPISISGYIKDSAEHPISGANVAFVGTGGGSGTTDQNGFYSTQVIAGNSYQVNITNPSFPLGVQFFSRYQDISFTSDSTFDLNLPQPKILTITVSDPNGHVVSGAGLALAVHANEFSADSSIGPVTMIQSKNEDVTGSTSNGGSYSLQLFPTTVDVAVTSPINSLQNASANVAVTEDTTLPIMLAVATNPITISGHILGYGNNPVIAANVTYQNASGTHAFHATTDQNGFYSTQVIAGESYSLIIKPSANDSSLPLNELTTPGVPLSFIETTTLDVQLPQPHKLTLIVTDPSGVPISGAGIELQVLGPAIPVNSSQGDLSMQVDKITNSSTTNSNGSYSILVYTSNANISITSPTNALQNISTNLNVTQDTTQIFALQATNHTPTAYANGPYSVNEGSDITLNGSGSDLDNDALTYSWDLDNNGSFETPGQSVSFHGVDGPATKHITVQVCDTHNACVTDSTDVTVNNVNPTVGTITASVNPVLEGSTTTLTGNFSDVGVLDTHTAQWNFGDGSSSPLCPPNTPDCSLTESNGSGTVTGTHTYATAGVYPVTLTVTDKDGGSSYNATSYYVSVYNPTSQGLFSAGQHYTSPAGALVGNSSAIGTVQFGLSYKYQGTVPVGHKEFSMDFKSENFHFDATTVNSLVISNGMAILTGTGTITGQSGTYNFLVTGDESTDNIRIRITDQSNNTIYDTQLNAADTATPTTHVTGNIIAH